MPFIGPALPPHLQKKQATNDEEKAEEVKDKSDDVDEDEETYGPALPAHLLRNSRPAESERPCEEACVSKKIVGPALPPGFQISRSNDPETDSESEDEGIVGPLPPSAQPSSYSAAEEIEQRAKKMKNKLTKTDEVEEPKRETWMLELPEVRSAAFGLGPRTFNRVTKPEIVGREEWTDTPNSEPQKPKDKKQVTTEADLLRQAQERKRNTELEAVIKDHDSKRRKKTLMEIHDKERKRKLKEEGVAVKERMPFDREKDLQTNQLDDAKRKAFLQRSKKLDGRFAGGSQKFL